jgi:hypothetical protein
MELNLAIISDTFWFTPTLVVMVAMTALLWEVLRQKSRVPACGPAPRPPGESLRMNLDDMNEKLVIRLLFTIGFAVLTGIVALGTSSGRNFALVHAVMFTGSAIALALTLWTWKLVARWRRTHLGFEGERMVGRELNLLMLDGCRVFHDLVDPKVGNLDHIIVAPHAIFVVETHTARQAKADPLAPDHRVLFNGRELRFPTVTTDKPVGQAARNARWLQKYLIRMIGIELPVHPLLTLPGWRVEHVGSGPVKVLNPDEIASAVVDKAAAPLYEAQRQQVINLLNEKCQYAPF